MNFFFFGLFECDLCEWCKCFLVVRNSQLVLLYVGIRLQWLINSTTICGHYEDTYSSGWVRYEVKFQGIEFGNFGGVSGGSWLSTNYVGVWLAAPQPQRHLFSFRISGFSWWEGKDRKERKAGWLDGWILEWDFGFGGRDWWWLCDKGGFTV